MSQANISFKQLVYELVGQIPEGRVMTYGDIAALCGQAAASRIVGGLAHFGPTDLPWHRVVNRFGGLAAGYYGGKNGHQKALEDEGITVEDLKVVDFENRRWTPINH
ncbi:MAG: MGMT family protein [Candidatus Saccharibacteria bacterium]|nr:MGMT family protein [Candidatus Saccharibacteria bacterium]